MTPEDRGTTQLQEDIRARLSRAEIPSHFIDAILELIADAEEWRETRR